jgi:hypothetical protein
MMHLRFTYVNTLTFIALASVLSVACSQKQIAGNTSTPSVPPAAYCTPTSLSPAPSPSYSKLITANYEYRTNGNGAVAAPKPIRYAEVEVLDSSGNRYQCLETNSSGQFTLVLPQNNQVYTIRVSSRANNSNVKAYVMSDPWNNTHYSISGTVTASNNTGGTLTASATTGSLTGGAFNILDQILEANIYLKNNTNAVPCTTLNGCSAFTVAPLLYAYWKKGFNPNTYLGNSATNGVSFYLRGTNELYILGGINGDVNTKDTDHFDNTIILHEYGHFIEDTYSVSDSRGGQHYGNTTIDPRLAWSEAFANFFQAAVTNNPVYRDTLGNVDGTPAVYIDEDLENTDSADDGTGADPLTDPGQGVFREFAITRALWDALDPANDETVDSPFSEIWTIFTSTIYGFANSSLNFRSAGLFFKLQAARDASADGANYKDWSNLMTQEKQTANQSNFATPLTLQAPSCTSGTINPEDLYNFGSVAGSNMFRDNDFFQYNHPGGTFRARIVYTAAVPNPTNLDLIIWKSDFRISDSDDIVAISATETAGTTDEVNLTLPAGLYMINVFGDTSNTSGNPTATNYNLQIHNGTSYQYACPTAGG